MLEMQVMMKKILIIVCLFIVAGCTSSQKQWEVESTPKTAEQAPSRLTRSVPPVVNAQGQPVYTPYQSPGQDAGISHYDESAPPDTRKSAAYADQLAQRRLAQQQASSSTFGNIQETHQFPVQESQPQLYDSPALPPVKVALLLPLSGEHADLGQAMLQAAQLALFDMGYSAFELIPRDTKATSQNAAQAAQSAIDDGAQLILGPVFAGSVAAVKPIAARYNINMVAFSTDWSLAGGNSFIMGFLPFTQVERVTTYAASQGLNKIAILAPNSDYGNAVVAAYNSLAYRAGMGTAEVARYIGEDSEASVTIRNFTRYDERVQAQEERKLSAATGAAHTVSPEDLPFQAVLMPLGGDQARSAANLLSYYDLGPHEVKRLGTGLWDDRGLATEPALDGAWFAAPSPELRRDFETRYRDLYGNRPERLATLAYDATALAAVLAKKSYYEQGRPSFDRTALTNQNGFAGIDGIFRFRQDGLIERGLAILEFDHGTIKVIDPPPSTFQHVN